MHEPFYDDEPPTHPLDEGDVDRWPAYYEEEFDDDGW